MSSGSTNVGTRRSARSTPITRSAQRSSPRCGRCWTASAPTRHARKLRHHLDECPTCLRYYGVEERIKTLIAAKCSGERAPESLRQRLRIQISRTTIIRG